MTTLLIVGSLLAVTIGAVLAAWLPARHLATRRRVMVNLVDGKALSGVLWSRRSGYLVLKDAALLVPGAEPAVMEGEVLVERERVDFVQVL